MLRRLGALEEIFWLMEHQSDGHFCTAIEIEGNTTPASWRDALDSVQQRRPLWAACIRADDEGVPCFYSTKGRRIPLLILDYSSTTDWSSFLVEELSSKFDATEAPLLRAVLLWSETRSVVILTAHHSIEDGLSLTLAVRDMLRALGGQTSAYQEVPPPQDVLMAQLLNRPSSFAVRHRISQPPSAIIEEDDGRRAPMQVRTLRYSCKFTEDIVGVCSKAGVTVGGLLAAACCFAVRKLSPVKREDSVAILSPVSRRALLDVGETSGLYLGWSRVLFESSEQDPNIWDSALHASKTWEQSLSLEAVLASNDMACHAVYSGQAAKMLQANSLRRDVYLSNQGKLPSDSRVGPLRLVGVWPVAPPGSSTEHRVSAATVNGTLCLTYATYLSDPEFPSMLERVLCEALDSAHVWGVESIELQ